MSNSASTVSYSERWTLKGVSVISSISNVSAEPGPQCHWRAIISEHSTRYILWYSSRESSVNIGITPRAGRPDKISIHSDKSFVSSPVSTPALWSARTPIQQVE
jgi:hypothetical protein